ncbi:MAG TPA: hypothetical protein VFL69_03630 [Marmoricola sp.]|nr:hypothetical protein [Marmoricola sp.]
MKHRRITSTLAALAVAGTCVAAGTVPAGAATPQPLGHQSILKMLAKDGHHFDARSHDFDIADKFFHKVLAARPDSPLAVVAEGGQRLTTFLPTDGAFRRMATDLVGKRFESERRVYRALLRVGRIGGVEGVLLTHLVSGRTLGHYRLRTAAPTSLDTLAGVPVKVRYRHHHVVLVDGDNVSPNSWIIPALKNLNKGNLQIAHGINSVLSPVVDKG